MRRIIIDVASSKLAPVKPEKREPKPPRTKEQKAQRKRTRSMNKFLKKQSAIRKGIENYEVFNLVMAFTDPED